MQPVLAGELAWYVTGRFYLSDQGEVADFGYFLHLAGIGPLFGGEPSEATAHFTFAAQPFRAPGLSNGALALGLDRRGSFSIYLQRQPRADFAAPSSFAQGECIARFERTSLVVGVTVDGAAAAGSPAPLFASNVFSARLVHSVAFEFGGEQHDLAVLLGAGVTQFGTAAEVPISPPPRGCRTVVPFVGSALALAGAPHPR